MDERNTFQLSNRKLSLCCTTMKYGRQPNFDIQFLTSSVVGVCGVYWPVVRRVCVVYTDL